jgi:hypothetical protein
MSIAIPTTPEDRVNSAYRKLLLIASAADVAIQAASFSVDPEDVLQGIAALARETAADLEPVPSPPVARALTALAGGTK